MTVAQRIRFFNFVRDIPYWISLDGEHDYCCSTKSMMLAEMLKGIGLKTRQIICDFDWRDSFFPPEILLLPFDENETTHQYLQVLIPESDQWVNVDPTWDRSLARLGFHIEEWDGLSDTGIAVKPKKIYSEQETKALIEKYGDPKLIKDYMDYHREFFQAINIWFAENRLKK